MSRKTNSRRIMKPYSPSRLKFFKDPSLDHFIYMLTGRCWNYSVTFRYTPDANEKGSIQRIVGFHTTDRNSLAQWRDLKKILVPDMVKGLPARYLQNGDLEICRFDYIGWFKPLENGPKQTNKTGHTKKNTVTE